jgi:hypothetical protein
MDATVLVLSDGCAINDYLRALWTDLPLRLASLHVSGKMLLLHTSLLMYLRISAQMASLLTSMRCPPTESVFVMPPGISPVTKCARSGRNTVSWTTYRSASADKVWIFVVNLSHRWLPVDFRISRCGATTDICPQCNQLETLAHLHLGVTILSPSSRSTFERHPLQPNTPNHCTGYPEMVSDRRHERP